MRSRPIADHRKQSQESIEEAGMSQSRRYTWRAQSQHHVLRHLTIINMFFFKTYSCTICSEIAIRKGSFSTIANGDCSTMQTSRPNHPTTYTYKTHTQTHTTVSPVHACIHSFIQSTIFTLSLFHKNEPSITTPFITIYNHPSINHALHVPLSMTFVHARMTLP